MTDILAAPAATARLGGPIAGRRLWLVLSVAIAVLLSLPAAAVLVNLAGPRGDVFAHLAATVLPEMLFNTFCLMLGVGLGTCVIGVGCAWAVTMLDFPGRRALSWMLFLPLAVPTYVGAFLYGDLLQFAGPLQTALRNIFGWRHGDYWFPDVMSLGGAIVLLSLCFYPYIYMLARAAFIDQSVCVLEVGRTLGLGPFARFRRIALPLARPLIAAGLGLVMMETLGEFGAVSYFGVPTFTTAIYRTWFGMGQPVAAAQLAGILLIFVGAALLIERMGRRAKRFSHSSARIRPLRPASLPRGMRVLVALLVALPFLLGFLLPLIWLIHLSLQGGDQLGVARLGLFAGRSFLLASGAALLLIALALLLAYARRLNPSPVIGGAIQFATLGYAVPGSVVAIGILLPLAAFDHGINALSGRILGIEPGLLLSGSGIALFYAYAVRFLAVAHGSVDGGLQRIRPSFDQSARLLGRSPLGVVRHVHAPLLRGSIFAAALLVFVDVLKELPATLIVRPFNFDTLAVRVYQLASDERLTEAATGSLVIVAIGLIPVIWLNIALAESRPGQSPAC